MTISLLRIKHFRNLSDVELLLKPGLNLISGKNGSGKTSLLEALYFLSLGRSFRSSHANKLIQHGAEKLSLFAQVCTVNRTIPIGVERDKKNTRMRVAEKEVSSCTELAYHVPLQLINAQSHLLLEAGPLYKRKFLDWGLFYQDNQFLLTWRCFERALKQRNSILRTQQSKAQLDAWTDELSKYGQKLHELRLTYIHQLKPFLLETVQALLSITNIRLNYLPGWQKDTPYSVALQNHYQEDYRVGFTQFGPHRADLELILNDLSAKHFLSRGQQKLLICAMILAQGKLLASQAHKGVIYLIDDLPAELDFQSKEKLLSLLLKQPQQVLITAINGDISENIAHTFPVFHVEHGEVTQMIKDKQAS